jgi:gliding motility-associated-like protein
MRNIIWILFCFVLATGTAQNDPFNLCDGFIVNEDHSYKIPNRDFENFSCCPSSYSQMNCLQNWVQPSSPTSDYQNTCGFVFPAAINAGLVPFPSGNGVVGMIFANGWQEYVGVCLTEALNPEDTFQLTLDIAYTPIDNLGNSCMAPPHAAIDIVLYGHPSCSALNMSGNGCPIFSDPSWIIIGTANYNPAMQWMELNIDIEASVPINAIILGSPCVLPAGYDLGGGCLPYFYIDNLRIEEILFDKVIEVMTIGHPCSEDYEIIASIDTFGGEWQWFLEGVELPGETDPTLKISENGYPSGTYSIRYIIGDFCLVEEIVIDLTISDAPIPICPPFVSVCENSDAFQLEEGSPGGGDFSGIGVNGNMFDPQVAGPGFHEITYTAYSINECPGTCTFFIEVQPLSPIVCPTDVTFCDFEDPYFIEGAFPLGGVFSGPGVENDVFTPENAGYGIHEIFYDYRGGVCDMQCSFFIYVNELPAPECPQDMSVCLSSPEFFIPPPSIPGGLYDGPGTTGDRFDPAAAGIGVHLITYYYMDNFFCEGTCTFTITVSADIDLTCPPDREVCTRTPAFTLQGATPAGGLFQGQGVTNNMFDPSASGAGVFRISYSLPAASCPDTCFFNITVIGDRQATCPADRSVCIDAAPFSIGQATPDGGVFSGPGLSGTDFDPAAAGAGQHNMTYEVTDADGCRFLCSFAIQVNALPQVTAPADGIYCSQDPSVTLTGGAPSGGSYSGPGVTAGVFNPSQAGAGVHPIRYDYTDANGCRNSDDFEIQIIAFLDAGPDIDLLCYRADTAYMAASGAGTWSFSPSNAGTAIMDSPTSPQAKVFDFSQAGTYVMYWEVGGVCRDSVTIEVDDDCRCIVRNNFIQTTQNLFCQVITSLLIIGETPTPDGGTYSWEWSQDGVSYIPVPSNGNNRDYTVTGLGPGVYFFRRIYETTTPEQCYSVSNVIRLEVVTQLEAGTQITFPTLCEGESATYLMRDLMSAFDPGGTWSEISTLPSQGGAFDPLTARFVADGQAPGVYRFRYIVNSDAPCVADTCVVTVQIFALPLAEITVDPGEVLDCQITSITLRAREGQHWTYSWFKSTNLLGSGSSYSVQDSGWYRLVVRDTLSGCEATATVFIGDNSEYPFIFIAEPLVLTCARTAVTLNAAGSQTNTHIIHEWFNAAGNRLNSTNLEQLVQQAGWYILTSTDTLNGCSNTDSILVLEDRIPPVVEAGPVQTLFCGRTTTSLAGTASNHSGAMTYRWTSQSGRILNGQNTLIPGIDGGGWYYLEVTNDENGCSSRDSVRIFLSDESFNITRADGDSICHEASTGQIAWNADGLPPMEVFLNGISYGNQQSIEGLRPGLYQVRIVDSLGCQADTTVYIQRRNPVKVELPVRIVMEQGDTTELEVIVNRDQNRLTSVQWLPSGLMSCDTCLRNLIWPDIQTNYTVLVTDEWGCTGLAALEVLVKRNIRVFIPGAFTPDGDGINDGFTLYSPEIKEIMHLEIFDRWGNRVFDKRSFPPNDPSVGWDGAFRAQQMTPAVFAFVAEVELHTGEKLIYHGEFQLLR